MGVPNQFVAKTIIESARVNENFSVACFSGEIRMYGDETAPTGWLICDGSSYLRSQYSDLFVVIGTKYGSVDGTHFNVPDLKGRVPVGKDLSQAEFETLGEVGGFKTHTLSVNEMPVHTHIQNAHTHVQNAHNHACTIDPGTDSSPPGNFRSDSGGAYTKYTQNATATNQNATATNQNTGSGSAHNNLQPYLVINFIIKT